MCSFLQTLGRFGGGFTHLYNDFFLMAIVEPLCVILICNMGLIISTLWASISMWPTEAVVSGEDWQEVSTSVRSLPLGGATVRKFVRAI